VTDTLARPRAAAATTSPSGSRLAGIGLLVAAACFVIYPAARTFSSEKGLDGAAAWSTTGWTVSHLCAMAAFTAVLGAAIVLGTNRGRLGGFAIGSFLVGVCAALPYYGGETFGLRAIGQRALATDDAELPGIQQEVRYGPGVVVFGVAVVAVAIGAIALAILLRRSGLMGAGAAVLALGFVLFLPQFTWSQPLRVAHGVVMATGCALLALGLLRRPALGR
jgi:hypothetical protein